MDVLAGFLQFLAAVAAWIIGIAGMIVLCLGVLTLSDLAIEKIALWLSSYGGDKE